MKLCGIFNMVLVIGAAMTILTGCGDDNRKDRIVLESYSYDAVAEIKESVTADLPGAEYCRLRGRGVLPVGIGDDDVSALRDTLMRLGGVAPGKNGRMMPAEVRELTATNLSPDSVEACSLRYKSVSVVLTTPQVIVWCVYGEGINCGAAHGMYATHYINYSINGHRIVGLADLMKKGYEKPLLDMLREKLSEEPDLVDDINAVTLPSTFRITPAGLKFMWGLYEIGPYSSGEIEVQLDTYEVIELLSRDGLKLLDAQEAD